MSAQQLLDCLDGVRRTGTGRWLARCPGHNDRSPSLSVRELEDGRVLVHDFGGCSVGDVLGVLGLEFDTLFPPRQIEYAARERAPVQAVDVLRALADETRLVAVAACNVGQGVALSDEDRARLVVASERLAEGLRFAGVSQ